MASQGSPARNSAARSSGGLNSAGTCNDTVLVIGGDGTKKIIGINWSYGANGTAVPQTHAPFYGRIIVLAGVAVDTNVVASGGYVAAPTQVDPIGQFGGRIVFDLDIQVFTGQPCYGQLSFDDSDGIEGALLATSGPISIILTGAIGSDGNLVAGVIGKLVVQFANVYNKTGGSADGGSYAFTPISGPPQ